MKRTFRIITCSQRRLRPQTTNTVTTSKYLTQKIQFSTSKERVKDDWRLNFQSHEYQPIWTAPQHTSQDGFNETLQPLNHLELDNTSKHLLANIHEISYSSDKNRFMDVPTTHECNTMIKRLGDLNKGGKTLEGRSHRAYMIWKKMEHCVDIRQDMQNIHSKKRFHYDIPTPNRETYRSVLLLHSKDSAVDIQDVSRKFSSPKRALEIVLKMEERFNEGNLDANPTAMMWNQVLSAWAYSKDSQKSYESAEILKTYVKDRADASSYGHVFKACASTKGGDKAKKLAYTVACNLWEEVQGSFLAKQKESFEEKAMERGSHMIAFAMKAISLMDDPKKKDSILKSQFNLSRELGLVNTHIIQIFCQNASDDTVNEVLGVHRRKKATGTYHAIPKEWKNNSLTAPSGW